MANNCLVTKLKDVVTNDNLRKLGTLYFEHYCAPTETHPAAYYFGNKFEGVEPITLTIEKGDAVFYADESRQNPIGKEIVIQPNQTRHYWIGSGNKTISVSNKYALTNITMQSSYTGEFTLYSDTATYLKKLSKIAIDHCDENVYLKDIKSDSKITYFFIGKSANSSGTVVGNLSDLNLTEVETFGVSTLVSQGLSELKGNFIDIVNPNLNFMFPDANSGIIFCPVEQMVQKLRSLGRETGEILVLWVGTSTDPRLTIGDNALNSMGINSSNVKIVWTTTTISIVKSDGTVVITVDA